MKRLKAKLEGELSWENEKPENTLGIRKSLHHPQHIKFHLEFILCISKFYIYRREDLERMKIPHEIVLILNECETLDFGLLEQLHYPCFCLKFKLEFTRNLYVLPFEMNCHLHLTIFSLYSRIPKICIIIQHRPKWTLSSCSFSDHIQLIRQISEVISNSARKIFQD